MKTKMLVTGATGKTGIPVVEELLKRGYPVRALVRRHDERSKRLEAFGAEITVGDFENLDSLRSAVRGVQRIYFAYPPQADRLVDVSANLAKAAKDEGVEALVNMSQITSRENAPSQLTRQHWLSENIFDWADIGAIHIRPGFFAENFIMFNAESIAREGRIYLPYGAQSHAAIAAKDIARVIVELLTHPEKYVGERLVLTGRDNLSIAQVAELFSEKLRRPIEYVEIPVSAWGDALNQRADVTDYLARHLMAVAQDHQDGVFNRLTDTVEQVTAQTAQSLSEFIDEHLVLFGGEQTQKAPLWISRH